MSSQGADSRSELWESGAGKGACRLLLLIVIFVIFRYIFYSVLSSLLENRKVKVGICYLIRFYYFLGLKLC